MSAPLPSRGEGRHGGQSPRPGARYRPFGAAASLAAAAVMAYASPAAAQVLVQGRAQQLFTPPQGCEIDVTVQLRQCQVANLYRCEAAPDDRFTTYADGEGIFYTSRIDAETRWITSISHVTGLVSNLLEDSVNHASFTELLETGEDLYDFRTEDSAGKIRRHVGVDRLTGAQVVIDGVPLEITEFDATAEDGEGAFLYRRSGQQFIHRDWRVFFGGTDVYENADGQRIDNNDTPVSFAFPGEEGFASLRPLFDCDVLLTGETAAQDLLPAAAPAAAALSSTRPAADAGL